MADIQNRTPIDLFLDEPRLARLATANPHNLQPHVVPVWYAWDGQSLWISAFRSTRKIKDLLRNPLCSVLIDVEEEGEGLRAVLFEGRAELIDDPAIVRPMATQIYTRYLGETGVLAANPQSWIVDPENTIIKLVPDKTYTWS